MSTRSKTHDTQYPQLIFDEDDDITSTRPFKTDVIHSKSRQKGSTRDHPTNRFGISLQKQTAFHLDYPLHVHMRGENK